MLEFPDCGVTALEGPGVYIDLLLLFWIELFHHPLVQKAPPVLLVVPVFFRELVQTVGLVLCRQCCEEEPSLYLTEVEVLLLVVAVVLWVRGSPQLLFRK